MSYKRTKRIGEEIRKVISSMISSGGIKDPRITSLVSITEVEVTQDLKYAYAYVSVLSGDKHSVLDGLKSASGFVRKEVGKEIKLRYTPEIIFRLDESIERGIQMSKLINELKDDGHNE